MRPAVPEELQAKNQDLPAEGMMFVGDQGAILSGFNTQNPRIISGKQAGLENKTPEPNYGPSQHIPEKFLDACLAGNQCQGSLRDAWPLTEAINLYAVALRAGKTLYYDGATQRITNIPEANQYLSREYRKGWDPSII